MTIGFSRATNEDKYELYVQWLRSIDSSFEFINFYGMSVEDALLSLEKCSGLVLTGGLDIHPSYYGKTEEENRCNYDLSRDVLEFALIEKALIMKLPILAICRGEQILNVSQGGDLIVDIAADYGNMIKHTSYTDDLIYQNVNIDKSGIIYDIIKETSFDIVSFHHQAVKTLAPCFRPTVFAEDGIIEAFEWSEPKGKGYLNAVQWHPEKGDYYNDLSQAIGRDFIKESYKYNN